MSLISYEPNAYYISDRACDSFKELYEIHLTDSFYVVRAKTNLKYKIVGHYRECCPHTDQCGHYHILPSSYRST